MKKIKVKNDYDFHYSSDVDRIVEVMRKAGYDVSPEQARLIWEKNSESMAAGWLMLPDADEQLLIEVSGFFDVVEED